MGNSFKKIKKHMMAEDAEEYEFPKTLDEFGYYFNDDGQLRDKEKNEAFNFVVNPDNHKYNQKRYEALGNVIEKFVYELLEKKHKLERVTVPIDAEPDEPTSFFYMSEDAMKNDKMLILVHGNGVVRAGQWARRLIINDCLDSGTQLPFIDWGLKNNYGVIVANTNNNSVKRNGREIEIRCNESPEDHMECVWKNFVQTSEAKNIAIVAHSYGGVATLELAMNHLDDFLERVNAIALTDSVHSFVHQDAGEDVIEFYKQHGMNWASSEDPLDTPLESRSDHCPTVSAGTGKHEYTSYSSMESIFKFLKEKYEESQNQKDRKNSSSKSKQKVNKSTKEETLHNKDDQSLQKKMSLDNKDQSEHEPMSQDFITDSQVDVEMNSQSQTQDDLPSEISAEKSKEEL